MIAVSQLECLRVTLWPHLHLALTCDTQGKCTLLTGVKQVKTHLDTSAKQETVWDLMQNHNDAFFVWTTQEDTMLAEQVGLWGGALFTLAEWHLMPTKVIRKNEERSCGHRLLHNSTHHDMEIIQNPSRKAFYSTVVLTCIYYFIGGLNTEHSKDITHKHDGKRGEEARRRSE